MKCPHCGYEFEEVTHCPNCGKAPGKPGRTKVYYDEAAVAQPEKNEIVPKEQPKPEVQESKAETPAQPEKKKKKSILFPLLIAAFFLYMTPGNPITMIIAAYCGLLVVIRVCSRLFGNT